MTLHEISLFKRGDTTFAVVFRSLASFGGYHKQISHKRSHRFGGDTNAPFCAPFFVLLTCECALRLMRGVETRNCSNSFSNAFSSGCCELDRCFVVATPVPTALLYVLSFKSSRFSRVTPEKLDEVPTSSARNERIPAITSISSPET
uniref:Ovule protein n=2 Tax=Parascaris univalens TaxID=6257 RepID=A0A915ADQ2_PARUN